MTDSVPALSARAGLTLDPVTLTRVYLALKVAVLIILALNTRFVMDEFWTISQPVWLFEETFETHWPGKAVGYVLFYEIAHAIGWDATSILITARLITVGLVVGLLGTVYLTARALGADRLTALLALALLLSVSTFVERSFRLRSEPLAILLAALALYAVIRTEADRTQALLSAGILAGLAFVTTQKSVYFNVALGAGLVLDAWISGRIFAGFRRGALLVFGWTLAILAYGVGFGGTQMLAVLENLVTGPLALALEGGSYYAGLERFVIQTLERNPLAWGVLAAGLGLMVLRLGQCGAHRIATIHALLITGFVFFHNQTWPYVFTMALPFLAPFGAVAIVLLGHRGRAGGIAALTLCLAIAFGSLIRNAQYMPHDNRAQLSLVAEAEAQLAPDDSYFDGIGMIPTRRMIPPVWLDAERVRQTLVAGPEGAFPQAFRKSDGPVLIIESYRTDALYELLGPALRDGYRRVGDHLLMRDAAGGASHNTDRPDLFQGIYSD